MGKFDNAECPKCGKSASGYAQVDELFGFRMNGGVKMVQSWCKECRG